MSVLRPGINISVGLKSRRDQKHSRHQREIRSKVQRTTVTVRFNNADAGLVFNSRYLQRRVVRDPVPSDRHFKIQKRGFGPCRQNSSSTTHGVLRSCPPRFKSALETCSVRPENMTHETTLYYYSLPSGLRTIYYYRRHGVMTTSSLSKTRP